MPHYSILAGTPTTEDWISKEAALAFMNDPGYAPHLAARTSGSTSNHDLIKSGENE